MGKLNKIIDTDLKATGSFSSIKKEGYRQAQGLLEDTELLETDPYTILLGQINSKVSDLVDESNTNDDKTGISNAQTAAIVLNTLKQGITNSQSKAIQDNSAKTGITDRQSNAIANNTEFNIKNFLRSTVAGTTAQIIGMNFAQNNKKQFTLTIVVETLNLKGLKTTLSTVLILT